MKCTYINRTIRLTHADAFIIIILIRHKKFKISKVRFSNQLGRHEFTVLLCIIIN